MNEAKIDPGKIKKTIEELANEGWEYTGRCFSYLRIYKNNNKRILYDEKSQSIYGQYTIKESKEL